MPAPQMDEAICVGADEDEAHHPVEDDHRLIMASDGSLSGRGADAGFATVTTRPRDNPAPR